MTLCPRESFQGLIMNISIFFLFPASSLLLILKDNLPSIGIIISNPTIDELPYLFTMIYVNWLNSKAKWGQRFLKL